MTDGFAEVPRGSVSVPEPTVWAIRFRKGVGLPFFVFSISKN